MSLKRSIEPAMTSAESPGFTTPLKREYFTYLWTTYMATTELSPTKEYAKEAPFTPNFKARTGTKIQVRAVHIIISLKVVLIRPMALSKLVSCVVAAAKTTLTLTRARGIRAGSHFS